MSSTALERSLFDARVAPARNRFLAKEPLSGDLRMAPFLKNAMAMVFSLSFSARQSCGALLITATASACVSQGQYDKLAQDTQHLEADLHGSQLRLQADDAELAKLRAGITDAEASLHDRDKRLADALAKDGELQAKLDGQTAEDAQLREELGRLGKNADHLLAEKGTLAGALTEAKARLEELRKAQAAAEARLALFRQLVAKFQKMIDAGELRVGLRNGRMVLQLSNDVLFDTGRVEIKGAGQAALREVASVLRTMSDRRFQVAGNTDNVPIDNARFPSNWELSAGRALEVVHFLIGQKMIPEALSAAGYGEFDPVASNDEAAGRARNRRIEITLQPQIDELVAVPADR
ncbi:MAG: OmpA family protein [Polyangiaceae bacterium]|jgi:chemotaxis protein MotB